MSVVFAGLVVRAPLRVAKAMAARLGTPLRFRGGSFTKGLSILFAENNKQVPVLDLEQELEELEVVAAVLSDDYPVLMVFVDGRVPSRYCVYFEDGDPVEAFGLEHELLVPLGKDGDAIPGAKPVPYPRRNRKQSYQVAVSAIDLGLKRMGGGTIDDLYRFVAKHL